MLVSVWKLQAIFDTWEVTVNAGMSWSGKRASEVDTVKLRQLDRARGHTTMSKFTEKQLKNASRGLTNITSHSELTVNA